MAPSTTRAHSVKAVADHEQRGAQRPQPWRREDKTAPVAGDAADQEPDDDDAPEPDVVASRAEAHGRPLAGVLQGSDEPDRDDEAPADDFQRGRCLMPRRPGHGRGWREAPGEATTPPSRRPLPAPGRLGGAHDHGIRCELDLGHVVLALSRCRATTRAAPVAVSFRLPPDWSPPGRRRRRGPEEPCQVRTPACPTDVGPALRRPHESGFPR